MAYSTYDKYQVALEWLSELSFQIGDNLSPDDIERHIENDLDNGEEQRAYLRAIFPVPNDTIQ